MKMKSEVIDYSVVVPVYNSANTLMELHERLTRTMRSHGGTYEIVMVDDGSTDECPHVIEQLKSMDACLKTIHLASNIGQHRAVLNAFREVHGQYIITIDDDLQYPPEEIPNLLKAMSDNPSLDVVIGVSRKKNQSSFRKVLGLMFQYANTVFLGQQPHIKITPFKVIKRALKEEMLSTVPGRFGTIGTELLLLKPTFANVQVTHCPRHHGISGYTILKTARMARDITGFYIFVLFSRIRTRTQ